MARRFSRGSNSAAYLSRRLLRDAPETFAGERSAVKEIPELHDLAAEDGKRYRCEHS
jgi:hypothetical protein